MKKTHEVMILEITFFSQSHHFVQRIGGEELDQEERFDQGVE
jgi:hypothetical protein